MLRTFIGAALAITVFISVLTHSPMIFQASLHAVNLWWNIVFPGMLPMLVFTEIILRSNFPLPALGRWLAGGEQASLSVSTSLLNRLLPNPFYVLLVVGAGFFQDALIGAMILMTMWLVVATLWLIRHVWQQFYVKSSQSPIVQRDRSSIAIGQLLAEAVSLTVTNLLVTGGFMLVGAVIVQLFYLLPQAHQLPPWLVLGLFDVTLGTQALISEVTYSASFSISMVTALIAFGGLTSLWKITALKPLDPSYVWTTVGSRFVFALFSGLTMYYVTLPLIYRLDLWFHRQPNYVHTMSQLNEQPSWWHISLPLTVFIVITYAIVRTPKFQD